MDWIRGQLLITSSTLLAFLWFVSTTITSTADGWILLSTSSTTSTLLFTDLQRCDTPQQILLQLGQKISPHVDPTGNLASLILVRLSKQLISIDNICDSSSSSNTKKQIATKDQLLWDALDGRTERNEEIIQHVINCLYNADCSNLDAIVEGTKAVSVLSRLLNISSMNQTMRIMNDFWINYQDNLLPHHLTGLKWAYDGLRYVSTNDSFHLPCKLLAQYNNHGIPFRIIPGLFSDRNDLNVENLELQVQFDVDDIRTSSNQIVSERRKTSWQGEKHVGPFLYSGKTMIRDDWSPTVTDIRDQLVHRLGSYYDCCLLNLYPEGCSGMRYHSDPDQGILWDYDTTVVSVGATRRFAFRPITVPTKHSQQQQQQQPHSFVVMHGDIVHMIGDCQMKFQHTVKKADHYNEKAKRISLVFKRSCVDTSSNKNAFFEQECC